MSLPTYITEYGNFLTETFSRERKLRKFITKNVDNIIDSNLLPFENGRIGVKF